LFAADQPFVRKQEEVPLVPDKRLENYYLQALRDALPEVQQGELVSPEPRIS